MGIGIKTGENEFEEEGPAEEWSAPFPKYHADALVSADFATDASFEKRGLTGLAPFSF